MNRFALLVLGTMALAVSTGLAAQAGPQAASAPPRTVAAPPRIGYPIGVQLATLVDHGTTLAGQFVQLPPSRVARVVSPVLVVVRDAREHGGYHFHQWRQDRLLVLLPAGTTVTRGERIVLWGDVRTVRGAQSSGELAGVKNDVVERYRNATLLVARGVTTTDGVDLAGRR